MTPTELALAQAFLVTIKAIGFGALALWAVELVIYARHNPKD